MAQGEALADHAADAEADIMHLLDAQHVERAFHVGRQRVHRVVAVHRRAAAMAAHVEAQHAIAGAEQRHELLGPHAAIGIQRMGEAYRRRGLRAGEVEVDSLAVEREQHWESPN
jgi:hemin uptake protein HemP